MTKILNVFIIVLFSLSCKSTLKKKEAIITTDITNFWTAYDKIKATQDSVLQVQYLKELFLDKGTIGLKDIMKARRYTINSYLKAIHKYPKFWETLRPNTLKIESYKEEINRGVASFKEIYPKAKEAKIFFTMGAFKTGGTTMEDKVLIGTEIALGDKTINVSELKEDFPHLPKYFSTNIPEESIVFSNVHEYVHTQQDTTIANSLLSKVMIEGVAEFVAEKALNIPSPNECTIYGKQHDAKIKEAFVKEMFTKYEVRWFWSNTNNQFKVGDLGYYIGYAICKSYYEQAKDKQQAIEEMITLDYLDEKALHSFINKSNYFKESIENYYEMSEKMRPRVVGISEFENNSINVDASIKTMTIEFSKEMDTGLMNLRLGPLGEENLLQVTNSLGWSEDKKKVTFEVALQSNLQQQLLITDIFRSKEGYLLAPYLVDITTK
ncbi:conserved protein of unknown function [Tenacibaculum sp. 190130A14a]|uniref:DUF2268 domain-containing protein n=1 Tax=Tenacibaculum polynesiense TaxID=3137857 RepID=A0ABP1F197_9FLAO